MNKASLREYIESVISTEFQSLREFGYDSGSPGQNELPAPSSGVDITAQQAQGLSSVLSSLGIDPTTVVKPQGGEEVVSEDFGTTPPPDPASPKRKPAKAKAEPKAKPEPKVKPEPKPKREKFVVDIDPSTIETAKRFFEVGKAGASWYYDAHNVIQGFPDEQDRVFFAILLASTSVQNAIYANFAEAAVLFNATKKDIEENYELLRQFTNETVLLTDPNLLKHPKFGELHIFKDAQTVKITNISAKFGNIKRTLALYLSGGLNKEAVRAVIANSVQPGKMSFDRRSPFIRKLKIANYALTLVDPEFASTKENWFNVVVDTWMFRIFYPQHANNDKAIGKLFGSEVAYMNVAKVVSDMAAKAGVSPHVMQAALWVGIKKTWEGESEEASNYITAIQQMITEYGEFWSEMEKDTANLAGIVSKLDARTVKTIIHQKRKEVLMGIQGRKIDPISNKPIGPAKQALTAQQIQQDADRIAQDRAEVDAENDWNAQYAPF